MTKIRPTDGN